MRTFFYGTTIQIKQFDIVLGEADEDGVTHDKPYVVRKLNGTDLVTIKNDLSEIACYSTEWFKKYNGELISKPSV